MKSAEARNSAWYQAFSKYRDNIFKSIECNFLAKVVKYDSKKHIADVQPLINMSDGTSSAQYLDVPVARTCYENEKAMRVGAVVVVAVLDRDSDNWDGTSATYTPASSRTHSANDSVITSVFR